MAPCGSILGSVTGSVVPQRLQIHHDNTHLHTYTHTYTHTCPQNHYNNRLLFHLLVSSIINVCIGGACFVVPQKVYLQYPCRGFSSPYSSYGCIPAPAHPQEKILFYRASHFGEDGRGFESEVSMYVCVCKIWRFRGPQKSPIFEGK